MASVLKLRRGNRIQNDAFTGAEGELSYDSTAKKIRVHDGITLGGKMLASETVSVKDFGAVGDGVADDTAAIQAAINAITPYPYVAGFVNGGGTSNQPAKILYCPRGRYKVTSTILLNPNLTIQGDGGLCSNLSNTTSNDAGTVFVAGAAFDGFMFDNAPWTNAGVRQQNIIGTFAQYDGNTRQVAGGIKLFDIRLEASTFDVYGGVNLVNCLNAVIQRCSIMRAGVPLRLSSMWLHNVSLNLMWPRNIGIAVLSSTTGEIQNNHIISGSVSSYPGFNYELYGFTTDPTYRGYTKGMYLQGSNNYVANNVIEGAGIQVGIAVTFNVGTQLINNYMEALPQACYISEVSSLYVLVGYTACPSAVLWHGHVYNPPNQGVVLDWTRLPARPGDGLNRLIVSDLISPSSTGCGENITLLPSNRSIIGTYNQYIAGIGFPAIVAAQGVANSTEVIYVSSTGSDSNFGFSSDKPVLSLQSAFNRMSLLNSNINNIVIYLQRGESFVTSSTPTIFAVAPLGNVFITGADFKGNGSIVKPVLTNNSNGTKSASIQLSSAQMNHLRFEGIRIEQQQATTVIENALCVIVTPVDIIFSNCEINVASNLFFVNTRTTATVQFRSCTTNGAGHVFGTAGTLSVNELISSGSTFTGVTSGLGTYLVNDVGFY